MWQAALDGPGSTWAGSLAQVPVVWSTGLAGTETDPTGYPVQFSFPVSGQDPAAWYPGTWLSGTTIRGYVAVCNIGPGSAILLPAGSYDVWCQVLTAAPNGPARKAGTITVS